MRPSPRPAELALVVLLVVAGAWLRWVHLGTPSLWWDEIVQIRIAERPTVADVIWSAREGGMPGSGNAGAMPLDYVALHAWLAATPAPAPEAFDRHVRIPAFAFAVAALPLAWVLGRMLGGPAAGALALALLAGSIPHVLYAAEARYYSLWVLATLANLLAFAALVHAPTARRAAVFALVAAGFVLSGLYAVFPIAVELAVLALVALRDGRDGRLLVAIGASSVAVAALLAVWITPTAVEWSYGRGTPAGTVADAVENAFRTYAGSTPWLAVVFGASLVVAPIVARRDRTAGALAAVFALSALAIPVIVTIARAKQYYFHPRHALFLLPMVLLATALVVGRAIDRLVRNAPAAALTGAALGLLATLGVALAYVANPLSFFRVTKTLRDYRGLARLVAARTADAPPGWRWLLLLEKRRPGHLSNPTVAFYLERWGLAGRVTLAGVDDPEAAATTLATRCATWCRGRVGMELHAAFDALDPFDQAGPMRRLLALRPPARADDLLGVGVVAWSAPPPKAAGVRETRLDGLTLVEPAAQGPP